MTEYPPPPPPGGGYPPPPPGGGYQPPPPGGGYPATKTNTLAIASLICSVAGLLCGVGSIVGIILGFVAMNQIKKTGEGGHGLALAGVIVGIVLLVLGVIGYAFYFS